MPIDHTLNSIEVRDVSFGYTDDVVLDHITLNIHKGDYVGVVGPNGGGKTTLLKIMLGLLTPTSGSVKLFGTELCRFQDWQKIGYVAQKAVNFDHAFPATVQEVVLMGRYARRGLLHTVTEKDKQKVDETLTLLEILNLKNRLIGDLSGGQQQRVFIARALVSDPEILFLDEPTVGVDVKMQEQFYRLLEKLNTTLNLTLVLVSHDIDVIAQEATELACINQRLVYYGEPKELMKGDHLEKLYGKKLKIILHDH